MKYTLILLFFPISISAQVSVVQDKEGESSILIAANSLVTFNSGDASIGANISRYTKPAGKEAHFWGANAKVKSNEGVSKLLDGYSFKPKFEAGLFGGKYLANANVSAFTYYYLSGGITNSYFKLRESSLTTKLRDESFFGWKLKFGLNHLGNIYESPLLSGVSFELGKYSNTEDLKVVDRFDMTSETTAIPNSIILSNKKSGFDGNYKYGTGCKINIDAIIFPSFISKQLGIGGYFRGALGTGFSRQNLGFGLFLGKPNAPDKIVVGLVYQINDLFNQLSNEQSFQKRTGVSITAGYSF